MSRYRLSLVWALRQLGREWRSGELTVLVLALVIAVAGVTAVNFFTGRVHQALEGQSAELLGGDLLLLSGQPPPPARLERAAALGLRTARTAEFPTMVLAGDNSQLAALKAASDGYPLRGRHRVAQVLFGPDAPVAGGPARGTVWAGSRLLTALGIQVGDEVSVGQLHLKVTAVLTSEPDQSEGVLFNVAPRLLMHYDDLAATGLVQPASRVRYRLLMAGEAPAVRQVRAEWEPGLAPGELLRDVKEARPEVRSALERGEAFLNLAALVSVLLAGTAVAMAVRRYVARHLDHCAVMRCLGAEQALISRLYLSQMAVLGLVAGLLGVGLGYLAQWGLVSLLGPLAGIPLPSPGLRPLFMGLITALVTLLGFAVPPVLQLKNVPTLRVLRRDLGGMRVGSVLAYGAGGLAFFAIVLLQAQQLKLAVAVVAGLGLMLVLLALLAGGGLLLLRPLKQRAGSLWRFGLANISRRAGQSVVQMVGFATGLMALLLLAVVRTDLLEEWEGRLPYDTPNRFLINIQPDQLSQVQTFFTAEGLEAPLLYPMVRARLTEINGRPVSADDFDTERGKRLVKREFNLSWAEQLQSDNQLVAGEWWEGATKGRPLISVEESLAKELGLKLGDTMSYDAGGVTVTAVIASLREVDWNSFKANFFVIAAPGVLDGLPVSYISGFYLPPEAHATMNRLVRQFPNITVLDVATILDQVRTIIGRVIMAVEYVFLFTVAAGLMVMYAAIHATRDERVREAAIMRTLGARRRQLLVNIMVEYAGLGLLSGLVAAVSAGVVGMLVAGRIFQLTYVPGPGLWLWGTLAGALGVGLAGTLGTRFVLSQPPLRTLRGSE